MATKPTTPVITWATSPNYSDGPDFGTPTKVSMPSTTDGHIGGAGFAPTAQEENWLRNNQQEWADYFEQATDENAALLTNAAASSTISGTVGNAASGYGFALSERFQSGGFRFSLNSNEGNILRVPSGLPGLYRVSLSIETSDLVQVGVATVKYQLRVIDSPGGSIIDFETIRDFRNNSALGSNFALVNFTTLLNITDPDADYIALASDSGSNQTINATSRMSIDLVSRVVA